MTALPLEGIRALDLSRILAGPFCAMMLGDLGADVIKVEHPRTGDDTRAWGPPFLDGGESAYFASVNKQKRSVGLDLATSEGRDILGRLLAEADIVIENFKMGTLERWGFGQTWVEAHAPRLVHATISGYGSFGPRAGAPGYDFVLQAESGIMAITGEADGTPMKLGVAIVDLCAGMLATIGLLAALEGRRRTGRGSHVETNLHDTGLQLLANVAGNYLASGHEAQRFGNGHPNIVPYRTYRTIDGWLAITVGNDAQFERFSRLLGHPEWARDERFATNPARVVNRETLDPLVEAEVARHTRDGLRIALEGASIPSAPINTVSEALTSEHATAREIVGEVEHATAGLIRLLRLPIELDGALPPIRRGPPTLGQDTDEVLASLGYNPDMITRLRRTAVIS